MSTPTGRFRRSDRLLDSRDYRRVSARGRRAAGRCFVLLSAPARPAGASTNVERRLGITVSRKVGIAVVRNGVKRRVREWFRTGRERLPAGFDWVVIARAPAASLGGLAVADELDRLVAKLAPADEGSGR